MMITSNTNPKIKLLRSLKMAKFRQETGLFLAEGLRLVGQAFDSKADIKSIVYSPEWLISEYGKSLIERAYKTGIEVLEVSKSVFESLARKDKPQGIAASIRQNWQNPETLFQKKGNKRTTWLAIEAIQNPGNLGTVLRTCDATGVDGLILLPPSTDPYDPAAVKASMGAVFTIPLYNFTYAQLAELLSINNYLTILGTSDKATHTAFSYDYPPHILLLIGSEREGLSKPLFDLCSDVLRIPMVGACDSLNLSVATGIMLYEIFKQNEMQSQ